jgi:hypothetical protein
VKPSNNDLIIYGFEGIVINHQITISSLICLLNVGSTTISSRLLGYSKKIPTIVVHIGIVLSTDLESLKSG